AEDGIRDFHVTGVQTCALPILEGRGVVWADGRGLPASRLASTLLERLDALGLGEGAGAGVALTPAAAEAAARVAAEERERARTRARPHHTRAHAENVSAHSPDRKSTRLNSSHVKI